MAIIVVIEDEPVLRLTFRHILEAEGHEVWEADNGRTGLALCRSKRPDLVITDLIMPELTGAEAVTILDRELPNTPVIAMSGMESDVPEAIAERTARFRFVLKPVKPQTLRTLVGTMLAPGA